MEKIMRDELPDGWELRVCSRCRYVESTATAAPRCSHHRAMYVDAESLVSTGWRFLSCEEMRGHGACDTDGHLWKLREDE